MSCVAMCTSTHAPNTRCWTSGDALHERGVGPWRRVGCLVAAGHSLLHPRLAVIPAGGCGVGGWGGMLAGMLLVECCTGRWCTVDNPHGWVRWRELLVGYCVRRQSRHSCDTHGGPAWCRTMVPCYCGSVHHVVHLPVSVCAAAWHASQVSGPRWGLPDRRQCCVPESALGGVHCHDQWRANMWMQ
jgi:hypothetical protein